MKNWITQINSDTSGIQVTETSPSSYSIGLNTNKKYCLDGGTAFQPVHDFILPTEGDDTWTVGNHTVSNMKWTAPSIEDLDIADTIKELDNFYQLKFTHTITVTPKTNVWYRNVSYKPVGEASLKYSNPANKVHCAIGPVGNNIADEITVQSVYIDYFFTEGYRNKYYNNWGTDAEVIKKIKKDIQAEIDAVLKQIGTIEISYEYITKKGA